MAEFSGSRHCMICGAVISNNNPDGIGSTCREVWYEAEKDAIYHFFGLELWKKKIDYWLPLFVSTFKETKFRSAFKKDFYASISTRYSEVDSRFSSKQLGIIKDMLVGEFGKITEYDADGILEGEKNIYREVRQIFRENRTPEQTEYMVNCAKKHYSDNNSI